MVRVEGGSVLLVFVLGLGCIHTQLLAQVWEQLIDTFRLLLQDIVEALVHLVSVLLDEPLHGLLVQSLVQGGVLCVHVDFAVGELEAFHRLLVKDDVEGDFLARLRHREEGMVLHLLPGGPSHRVLLHGLAEELEALERDLDVLGPSPCAFFDLAVKQLKGHLVRGLLSHIEDEHASQHLVEDDPDGPHINLVAVAGPPAPIRLYLLCRHHQGRPLERKGAISASLPLSTTARATIIRARWILELSRIAQVRYLHNEDLILQVHCCIVHGLRIGPIREVHQYVVQLHVPMHYAHFVEGRAPRYNLADALFGHFLTKPRLAVQQILQAAPVGILQNAVIVRPRPNNLLQSDHVWTSYHLEKDEFAAETQHSLFPVVGVAAALLKDPIVGRHFSGKYLTLHIELPNGGLGAAAQLVLEDVVAPGVLPTLHRFRLLLLGCSIRPIAQVAALLFLLYHILKK